MGLFLQLRQFFVLLRVTEVVRDVPATENLPLFETYIIYKAHAAGHLPKELFLFLLQVDPIPHALQNLHIAIL